MIYFSTIKGSLVAISMTAMSLILWLSGSFWYDAYVQRLDAAQLLQSVETEDLLFDVSRSLAEERSLMHLVLSDPESIHDSHIQKANTQRQISTFQFGQILSKIATAMKTPSHVRRMTFKPDAIHETLDQVQKLSIRLDRQYEQAIEQTALSAITHDERIQDSIFASYTALINETQVLRRAVNFIPRHNELDISHLQILRVATWQFSEAIAKESSLLSGVIVSENSLDSRDLQKLESLHYETLGVWKTLKRYTEKRSADPGLTAAIAEIELRYFTEFVKLRRKIVDDFRRDGKSAMTLDQWQLVLTRSTTELENLDRLNSEVIKHIAVDVEAHGVRRLIIDSVVLSVGLIIGLAIIGIIRRVQHQATHDALTGLPGRILFEDLLQHALSESSGVTPVVLLFADLDGFKHINDTLGHSVGDALLVQVAGRLKAFSGDGAIVARLGGDEFAIIKRVDREEQDIAECANRLILEISREFQVEDIHTSIGISVGVSVYPKDASSANDLKKCADIAMYHAKADGKNCVRSFDHEIATIYKHRVKLEADLKKAIDERQFSLVYQPQVGQISQHVEGVEALIRWQHPERGMISPVEFIPVAEDAGLLGLIGDWVLDEACRQMAVWQRDGLSHIRVAVNVSAQQFANANFVELVQSICHDHGVNPVNLELEVTESVVMKDINRVIDTFNRLRDLQIQIAIDDFGTGYSSLSYLQDLPVDTLKIDRSFISRLDKEKSDKSVAHAIVLLAKSFGLKTVAEGVETEEQLDIVREFECDYVQGYYYSKPVSPNELSGCVQDIASLHPPGRRAA
ncbi:MAG: bifunctional diguanylate cyclase/phosphodiesterase [Rhodothermales bacterium]|nr:bifunctional diguanylate cyclase/phosphodiesterase [Rhodothermales bacterium]